MSTTPHHILLKAQCKKASDPDPNNNANLAGLPIPPIGTNGPITIKVPKKRVANVWMARINKHGVPKKNSHLGSFETLEEKVIVLELLNRKNRTNHQQT